MATLNDFRQLGGVVGDSYFDEQGEWRIILVYSDGDYNWGLINPSAAVIDPPDTAVTLSARVDTIETALGPDVLDCSFDMVVLLENKLI